MAIMKYQLLDGLPLATAPIRYLHFNLQLVDCATPESTDSLFKAASISVGDHLKSPFNQCFFCDLIILVLCLLFGQPLRKEHDSLPSNICRLFIWCIVLHGGLYKGSSSLCL